jgi:tetratricopeptide (TPR) repeat protein
MKNPPPENSRAAQIRALCDQGLWPEALAFAQSWSAAQPAASEAHFFQGVTLAALGKFDAAEIAYRAALKLDAAHFKTWNNLAALLFGPLNRPVDAAQCLAQALKLEPRNALGWANLASLNGQLERHADALACAERALAIEPQLVEAQLHRARAAQALGKPEIVRAVSETLARLPAEKFRRPR